MSHPTAQPRSGIVAVAVTLLLASTVVACGGGGSSSGVPVIHWYSYKEPGGSYAEAISRCNAANKDKFKIEFTQLPDDADAQRQQLVRRLAAKDSSIDLINMDVIWTAEFAEAGWIRPWSPTQAAQVTEGAIPATVETATYKGRLWAAPYTSNTQLLWYRKDLVKDPPRTWAAMIKAAEDLAKAGKPHYIEVQGNRYEGYTVLFTTLLASAGGEVVTDRGKVSLEPEPTRLALKTIEDLSRSKAADPSLSTAKEDSTRLAFQDGNAAFMANYPFIYASAKSEKPSFVDKIGWTTLPSVIEGQPSHVTIGGFNLGVASFGSNPQAAFAAAACLRQDANQVLAATKGGLLPVTEKLYDTPEVKKAFPFADDLRQSIRDGTQRAQTPAYNDVSLAIQRTLHPPSSVTPAKADDLRNKVRDALASRGLL